MKSWEKFNTGLKSNRRGIYLSLGCWTLLILLLGTLSFLQLSGFTKTIAISQARFHLQKDIAFRAWVASQGGVYVPINDKTPPNPYLSHLPYRDIQLPDNTPLTLLNPAYLIRLISKEHETLYGVTAKITSLKPLNSVNKADKWETEALLSFEKGNKQALLFTDINNSPYLRFMLPLVTQKSCLKCHADQGYTVGDIRGGLGVLLPTSAIVEEQHSAFKKQLCILATIWICGILFIIRQGHKILQRQQETLSIAEELRNNREQLKQSLTERDAVTTAVLDIMYMINADGYLHWWNKSLETITERAAEELPTTRISKLFIEDDREKVAHAMKKVLTEGHAIVEGKLNTTKGRRHFQLTSVRAMYDNKPYIVGVGRDLSEHRHVEKILLQARNDAESANRAKSAFLSNMSHELRTPLNAILGYAQIFANDTDLSERHKRGIKTIHESGEHLLMLINDILDLSKIEAGKMKLVPTEFNIADFFNGVVDVIKIRAADKRIDFRYRISEDLPLSIVSDELRLRQVLFNLLSNAIKFTETGFCSLVVDTTECEQNMVSLMIHVKDTGVGIHPEMREKIFHPFQQSGDPFKFAEGSGLGLAISRRIITLMEGELAVNSIIGEGSDFFFSIRVPIGKRKKGLIANTLQQQFSIDGKLSYPIPERATTDMILRNIKGGDIETVTELIGAVAEMESGKYQQFAKQMASMAEDFKLSELETFIGKACDNSER